MLVVLIIPVVYETFHAFFLSLFVKAVLFIDE